MNSELFNELKDGHLFSLVQAEKEQRLAAKNAGDRMFFGDSGEVQFQIHPKFYHHWGQRYGYKIWEDEQFVREFLRDNPECRIKSHSRKIQVGHGSLDKSSNFFRRPIRGTKFHKKYGAGVA